MNALTPTQVESLKERMLTRRGELVVEIREKLAESREHSSLATVEQRLEGGDSALADLIASTDMAMVRRDVEEIREIDAAIGRIEAGTYGECTQCGEPIGFARLEAEPTATRCIRDQSRWEREHGSGGGASL
ncbi:MAG: TraR/DksA C4-type zinc finger protein [Burkholderiales bacterium]|nr:TraR/DksA C4-type zinc finger protein [Burkholderiales bacterium]